MILQFTICSHDRKLLTYQTDTPAIEECIRTHFREKDESARFAVGRYGGKPDPFKSPITPLGSFRAGLFFDIVDLVQNRFPNMVHVIVPPEVMAVVRPCNMDVEVSQPEGLPEEKKLRYYQEACVALGAKWGRGVFAHATGSGKSLSMYCLIRSIEDAQQKPIRTLIIVPGVGLVEQLHSDFLEYGCPGYKVQKYCSSSDAFPTADIVIVNQEYLLPRKVMARQKLRPDNPVFHKTRFGFVGKGSRK
jgi:hypothetical protein